MKIEEMKRVVRYYSENKYDAPTRKEMLAVCDFALAAAEIVEELAKKDCGQVHPLEPTTEKCLPCRARALVNKEPTR